MVLIDRGFVPDAFKDRAARRESEPSGSVTVTGLARAPESQGTFIPDNDPDRNRWFWRDLAGMTKSMGLQGTIAPFFLDAERSETGGAWPQGGQTRLDIPNDHLQYAITWFLLALSLLVIYAIYVWRSWRGTEESQVAGKGGGR
jgi:surfeit locus 1 family protein